MVFTAGVLQGHSSVHSRHTFHNLPCLLNSRRSRLPFSAQASSEQAPALASKPALSGPPKRAPASTPSEAVPLQQPKASDSGRSIVDKVNGLVNGNNGQPRSNGGDRPPPSKAGDKKGHYQKQKQQARAEAQQAQNEFNRPPKNGNGKKSQPQGRTESNLSQAGTRDVTSKAKQQGNGAAQQPVVASQPAHNAPQQQKPRVADSAQLPVQPAPQQQKPHVTNSALQPAPQQHKPRATEPAQLPVQAAPQQQKPRASEPAQLPAQLTLQPPKSSLPAMAGPPARRPAVKPGVSSQLLPTLPRDHRPAFQSYDRAAQSMDEPAQSLDQPASIASTNNAIDMPAKPSSEPSTSSTASYVRFADSDSVNAMPAAPPRQPAEAATAPQPSQADAAPSGQALLPPGQQSVSESTTTVLSGQASSPPEQPSATELTPAPTPPSAPVSPSLPRPTIAGPPKRPPPRPSQQSFQRQELPGGGSFLSRSRDMSVDFPSGSGPSVMPDSIPPLPTPSPQAGLRGPARPSMEAPTAAAARQVAAEQPLLAAKPGLRSPPNRTSAPHIDIARFDMAPSRSRPQQQNGNGTGNSNGNGAPPRQAPAVDPAVAGVNGVAAPVRGPAKKLRGKKRGGEEEEEGKGKGKGKGVGKGDDGRKSITRVDAGSRRVTRAQRKQQRNEAREAGRPEKEDIVEVGLEGMSVQDLSDRLQVAPTEILKELFMKGIMAQVNQVLDFETVQIIGEAFEVDILEKEEARIDNMARKTVDYLDEDDIDHLQPRPPVVVVMGHVDHGKTSLLDTIRKSTVAAGEAGGITQAIGAYTVGVAMDGEQKSVTFLDTPGHEAFSAMRARGARVTDIAIIVVAADDGVRPQTLEAISHANAAEVPIVVAINKVDKDGANPERVKQELSEAGLLPEEWGGKTPMIQISAKKGTGVDDLLETVALVAEVEQLMANPVKAAAGTVLEAHLDKRVGAIATLLVQTGTLHVGDVVVAGSAYGKVRSMKDNFGDKVAATPSTAVQMSGLHVVPVAGDDFIVAKTLDEGLSGVQGRKIAEVAGAAQRVGRLADQAGGGSMITTKSLASFDDDGEEEVLHRLNVILKTDASGSLEAVRSALGGLPQDSVVLRYLMATPNDITVSDIDLAAASKGLVLGFNVEPSETVLAAAKQQGVTVRSYKVIYDLLDDMRAAMEGKLAALEQRVPLGEAEVRAVFGKGSKLVAGCMVTEGVLRAECFLVVKRGRKQIWEGELSSLRRVKESVSEISQGNECGVGCKAFIDWAEGDKIEAFELVSKRRTLEDAPPAPQFVAAVPEQ